jgi:hypothetical protein
MDAVSKLQFWFALTVGLMLVFIVSTHVIGGSTGTLLLVLGMLVASVAVMMRSVSSH